MTRSPTVFVAAFTLVLLGCSVRHIVYPAPAISVLEPPDPLRSVDLALANGTRISAWVHVDGHHPPDRPAVLFLHGNGENLETMRMSGLFDDLLALGVPFVALDYPGYGRSGGVPSEASLVEAGVVTLEWMRQRFGGRPQVVVGWSLGAAVAIALAAGHPEHCDGLVAMSAWTSLAAVGAFHFPRWLVDLALADRYDSEAAADRVGCPGLVIHGARDRIIPVEQGKVVAEALGAGWLEVPTAGHNDLLAHEDVWRRLSGFLGAIRPSSPPEPPPGL